MMNPSRSSSRKVAVRDFGLTPTTRSSILIHIYDEVFTLAGRFYPGYARYRQRIGRRRRIRVFVLDAA